MTYYIRSALHSVLEAALFPIWMLIHCSAGIAALHRDFCDQSCCLVMQVDTLLRVEIQTKL